MSFNLNIGYRNDCVLHISVCCELKDVVTHFSLLHIYTWKHMKCVHQVNTRPVLHRHVPL